MGNLLIGKNSAIIGFSMFFIAISSLVVGLLAVNYCFTAGETFFGVLSIAVIIVWLFIVAMLYKMSLNGIEMREYILPLIGFNYLVNHTTKQIHRLKHSKADCLIEQIKKKRYATKLYVKYLLKYKKYDGCIFCYRETDKSRK